MFLGFDDFCKAVPAFHNRLKSFLNLGFIHPIFCSWFLVTFKFWWQSYKNTKISCNLCLHFARQDGQGGEKKLTELKWPKYLKPNDKSMEWTKQNILIAIHQYDNLESFSSHGVHLVAFIHSSFHFSYDLFFNSFSKKSKFKLLQPQFLAPRLYFEWKKCVWMYYVLYAY